LDPLATESPRQFGETARFSRLAALARIGLIEQHLTEIRRNLMNPKMDAQVRRFSTASRGEPISPVSRAVKRSAVGRI
jgi:hypothetical protein